MGAQGAERNARFLALMMCCMCTSRVACALTPFPLRTRHAGAERPRATGPLPRIPLHVHLVTFDGILSV